MKRLREIEIELESYFQKLLDKAQPVITGFSFEPDLFFITHGVYPKFNILFATQGEIIAPGASIAAIC